MKNKFILIFSVFAFLSVPVAARAQTTMDISMKIQAILDQFSEIRSGLKQIKSSMNVETMMKNLGGSGDWKEKLKGAGGMLGKNKGEGAEKQAFLVLPDELSEKVDDPKAAQKWLQEKFKVEKGADFKVKDAVRKELTEMQYTTISSVYAKAVATRKQLDKSLNAVEELRQDAESKESETDLQNEINKIALLKVAQTTNTQLLTSSRLQMSAVSKISNQNSVSTEAEK